MSKKERGRKVRMKLIRNKNQIFAYRTTVTPEKSIEEIKKNLKKYGCQGFQYTEHPDTNQKAIRFYVPSDTGRLLVHLDIPEIHEKMISGKTKYLEKESYRALVLIVKAKLNLIELGEPIEEVFLLNMITPDGKMLKNILTKDLPLLTQGEMQ